MSSARETLKAKLAKREAVSGVVLNFSSSMLSLNLAKLGFDFIFVDCEHGGPDVGQVFDIALAARTGGSVALVRPWSKDPGLIRRYLDYGVDGIIMPNLESSSEVQTFRNLVHAAAPPDEESILLFGIIESVDGVSAADTIALAPGIDAIIVGSADLAVSYGFSRRTGQAKIRDEVFNVATIARDNGKSVGLVVGRFDMQESMSAGMNVHFTSARDLLARGAASFRKTIGV